MATLRGHLVTPSGIIPGTLRFSTHIEGLEPSPVRASAPYILPGFIDTHVHGGGGGDTMDGAEGVWKLARFHLQHGSTTLYPTTMTNPWQRILAALEGVREVMATAEAGLPNLPGVHLEGPFISPKRLGAQPPHAILPEREKLEEVLSFDVVRLVTMAPELSGAVAAAERFAGEGVRVSIGHSVASYEQCLTLIEAVQARGGTVGFTHLYNAMGGLSGRDPGVVGAALAQVDAYAELILDGHHVHTGSFLAACAAKEKLSLITDAIRAAGLPEGQTELGGLAVTVKNGAARLADGTLAGSVLTLDRALRNAVEGGIPLERVSRMLSGTPARYMGLTDRGELTVGKRADMVVLNERLEPQAVYVAGQEVTA